MIMVEITHCSIPDDWCYAAKNLWYLGNNSVEMLGFIPMWITGENCSMVEQIDRNYAHGGGWRNFEGFDVDSVSGEMKYPGDPAMTPIALYRSRNEVLWMYRHGWVTVMNMNNTTFRTARID